MRFVVIAVTLAYFCTVAPAQDQPKLGNCYDTAMAQAELNRCASKLANEADVKLNDAYKRLMTEAANDSVSLAKFRAFENAWIKYRDTYLDAAYASADKQGAYGSIFPMEFHDLRRRLTEDQTRVLAQMLSDYLEAKSSLPHTSSTG
jgi:uncharacterized protein YecT (DUF1311 family)